MWKTKNPTANIENAIGSNVESIEKMANETVIRMQDLVIEDVQVGFDIQFTNDDNAEHKLLILPFYNYVGDLTLI